jgi:hypothetical protein
MSFKPWDGAVSHIWYRMSNKHDWFSNCITRSHLSKNTRWSRLDATEYPECFECVVNGEDLYCKGFQRKVSR